MKATRKLIPAIAMLLISAVMMSTATFAWFSTNSAVTATNLVVTAKAESTFLVISSVPTGDWTTSEAYQTITAEAADATGNENVLIPIAFDETTVGVDENSLDEKYRWYTATGNAIDASGMKTGTKTEVKGTPGAQYVFKRTFYFRIANNFAASSNLVLSGVTIAGENQAYSDAVSVVAVKSGETDWSEANAYDATTKKVTVKNALHETVTSSTVVAVDVYVFIDGDHVDVFTKNIEHLKNLNVTVSFEVGGTIN